MNLVKYLCRVSLAAGLLSHIGFVFAEMSQEDIIGGSVSHLSSHPYVVSIQGSQGHYCGGSLIAPKVVLTAAHCAEDLNRQHLTDKVVIGSQKLSPISAQAEVHGIANFHIHPRFQHGSEDLTYDYAILELSEASQMRPVSMISTGQDPSSLAPHGDVFVLGWGTTSENGDLSNQLREVSLPLVSKNICEASYPHLINDSVICAGLPGGGKDSCQGDSGGPMVVRENGTELQVGIVSWGKGCAEAHYYGLYANLALGREWIDQMVSEISSRH